MQCEQNGGILAIFQANAPYTIGLDQIVQSKKIQRLAKAGFKHSLIKINAKHRRMYEWTYGHTDVDQEIS